MSLDIKVKKKPPSQSNISPRPVNQPVKDAARINLPPSNQGSSTSSQPPKAKAKKTKSNMWWWLLFVLLFVLFVGVIYYIWRDNNTDDGVKTAKPVSTPAGIVSNFVTETTPPPNAEVDSPQNFDISLVNERVAEFEQMTNNFIDSVIINSSSSTTTVKSIEDFDQQARSLNDLAQTLADFLPNQYEQLQVLARTSSNYDQTKDYLVSIDDYLGRVRGEIQVLDALLALGENQNFSNEITVSVKNLNEYFKQIKNLTKLVDQLLTNTAGKETENILSTSTTSTVSSTVDIEN